MSTAGGGPVTVVGKSFGGRKPVIDCEGSARIFQGFGTSSLHLENVEVRNTNDNAVYARDSTSVSLLSVDFFHCDGRTVRTTDSASFNIRNSNISWATGSGWGNNVVHNSNGNSYVYDSFFGYNTGMGGGGVYCSGGNVYVHNSSFIGNSVSNDGAALMVPGGTMWVYDSFGAENTAQFSSFMRSDGRGKVYNTVTVNHVEGLWVYGAYFGGDLTISGCTFDSNEIYGIFGQDDGVQITIDDTAVRNMPGAGYTALIAQYGAGVTVTNSVFEAIAGPAIYSYLSGDCRASNNNITDSISAPNNTYNILFYVDEGKTAVIENNLLERTVGHGVAVAGGTATMRDNTIRDAVINSTIWTFYSEGTATNNNVYNTVGADYYLDFGDNGGGAVFSDAEAVDVSLLYAFYGFPAADLLIRDITFTRVTVSSYMYFCLGGRFEVENFFVSPPHVLTNTSLAFLVLADATLANVQPVTTSDSYSLSHLFNLTASSLTLMDTTIENFTTPAAGGIVSGATGNSLSLVDCVVNNVHSGGNGGLFDALDASSHFVSDGSVITNVSAAGSGGVVYGSGGGSVVFRDTTVVGVTAGGEGGVVAVFEGVDVNITGSTFTRNEARSGGAVFFAGGYLRISDSSVVDNTIRASGGGVFVFLPLHTTVIERSHFEHNTDLQLFVFAAKELTLHMVGVVAHAGQVGVELLSVVDGVISNSSVWSESGGEALRLTASQHVTLFGSLVAGDLPSGTPSLICTASTVNVVGGVACFNGGGGAQCTACTLTGDASTCSDLNGGGSCVDACAAASWCVPGSLLESTASNAGCPSCTGACYSGSDGCDPLSTNCFDTRSGGFTCACDTGFETLANNSCTDINECALGIDNCDSTSVCTNTPGSFTCDCVSGYINDGPLSCTDKDECVGNPCGVEFDCYNSVGSYVCVCGAGYYIYGNSTQCRPCTDGWLTLQNQFCVSECPTGFVTVGNTTCVDINECATMPCGEGTKCFNTAGSYSCGGCKAGYYKYNSSTECRPCAKGWYVLGGATCLECGAGTYTNATNSPLCSPCDEYSTSGPGASSCYCKSIYVDLGSGCVANCTIGQYAYSATLCLNCPKGTYGSAAGLCDSCPPFTTTASTGHIGVDSCDCVAGDLVRSPFDFEGLGCVPWCSPGRYADVDDGLCLSCPANTYKENAGFGDNCTACPVAGMYTEGAGSANLTDCQCGEGQQVEFVAGAVSCTTYCAPGLARPSPWEECEVCGSSTYSAQPNSKTCSICPANTFAPPQSTSVSACRCRRGFYSPTKETGRSCVPCPDGAECAGGLSEPVAREGFAPVGEEFIACTPASACIGKGDCEVGYSGERCATCSAGYHRSSGYCQPCGAGTLVALIVGVLCALVLVAALVGFNLKEGSSQRLRSTVITLNAIQIIAQFGRLHIGWPLYVQRMFDVLGAFNLNVELVAPECAIGTTNPFAIRFVTAMVMPLLLAAVLACGYVVFLLVSVALPVSKSTAYSVRRSVLLCALQLILILYLPLSVATFEFFDCVPAGSMKVLASSPEVECGSGVWKRLLPLAAICVVLYPVAVPLVLTGCLAYGRYIYGAEDFDLRFGYLTNRYAPEYFYYELVVMARKLVVAITLTFVTASPYIQAGTTVIWILFNFLIHHIAKPYATDFLNLVESGALFSVLLIIQEGVMFQDSLLSPVAKATIILLTLFVFFVCAGVSITYEYSGVLADHSEGKRRDTVKAREFEATVESKRAGVGVVDYTDGGSGDPDSPEVYGDAMFLRSENSAFAAGINSAVSGGGYSREGTEYGGRGDDMTMQPSILAATADAESSSSTATDEYGGTLESVGGEYDDERTVAATSAVSSASTFAMAPGNTKFSMQPSRPAPAANHANDIHPSILASMGDVGGELGGGGVDSCDSSSLASLPLPPPRVAPPPRSQPTHPTPDTSALDSLPLPPPRVAPPPSKPADDNGGAIANLKTVVPPPPQTPPPRPGRPAVAPQRSTAGLSSRRDTNSSPPPPVTPPRRPSAARKPPRPPPE